MYSNSNVTLDSIKELADSTEDAWQGILNKDVKAWGEATRRCFDAQLKMFPNMATAGVYETIARMKDSVYGWKLSGAGGGGYLILISEKTIPYAIRVRARRVD